MGLAPFRPVRVSIGGTRSGSEASRQFRAIEENFRQWTLHLFGQSGEVLKQALQPTLDKAIMYCPVKTGALRKSAYLEVRRAGLLRGWQAEIGFGRGGVPNYAIYVHEVPYKHKDPTRWKFLQAALQEDSSAIQQRLAGGYRTVAGT